MLSCPPRLPAGRKPYTALFSAVALRVDRGRPGAELRDLATRPRAATPHRFEDHRKKRRFAALLIPYRNYASVRAPVAQSRSENGSICSRAGRDERLTCRPVLPERGTIEARRDLRKPFLPWTMGPIAQHLKADADAPDRHSHLPVQRRRGLDTAADRAGRSIRKGPPATPRPHARGL